MNNDICGDGLVEEDILKKRISHEVRLALNESRISGMEAKLNKLDLSISGFDSKLDAIYEKLNDYKSSADRKPTWFLTGVITTLFSLIVALAIFVITRL